MVSFKYKITVIGGSNVGKTCTIQRYCHNKYDGMEKATIENDISTKKIRQNDDEICLEIWDTAGQERYGAETVLTYRNIKGVLLMYDITSLLSFKSLIQRIQNIEENAGSDVVRVLVGNKCDAPEEKRQQKLIKSQSEEIKVLKNQIMKEQNKCCNII